MERSRASGCVRTPAATRPLFLSVISCLLPPPSIPHTCVLTHPHGARLLRAAGLRPHRAFSSTRCAARRPVLHLQFPRRFSRPQSPRSQRFPRRMASLLGALRRAVRQADRRFTSSCNRLPSLRRTPHPAPSDPLRFSPTRSAPAHPQHTPTQGKTDLKSRESLAVSTSMEG